jgi:hypothetical protein
MIMIMLILIGTTGTALSVRAAPLFALTPTAEPPTRVPPTSVPPTSVPPPATSAPPTSTPPMATSIPPTATPKPKRESDQHDDPTPTPSQVIVPTIDVAISPTTAPTDIAVVSASPTAVAARLPRTGSADEAASRHALLALLGVVTIGLSVLLRRRGAAKT